MERNGLRRLIPIVLVIVVIGIAITALVSVGRTFFGGSSPSPSASPSSSSQATTDSQGLTSTLADRSVRMTVRGPITAQESFHSYTVTISPDARNMTTYQGYLGQTVDNSQLTNNLQAYEQFVFALDRANLMEGTPLTGDANDTRGICATGRIYLFEMLQGTNTVKALWTSSCKGSAGSLKANLTQVSQLFRSQIPNFTKLATKVNLN